jgi:hypothetical protein
LFHEIGFCTKVINSGKDRKTDCHIRQNDTMTEILAGKNLVILTAFHEKDQKQKKKWHGTAIDNNNET